MGLNLAIVGASGLVGRTMIEVIKERKIQYDSIKLFGSERSAGSFIEINDENIMINELTLDSFEGIDVALFSAGGDTSKTYAPIAREFDTIVIDNSSAWRRDENCPLVVPEVNSHDLQNHKNIIANPNCSTIQLVVALKPLQEKFGLKRVICSTYQSISGAGQSGIDKLQKEINSGESEDAPIAFNTLFHPFEDNGFTNEENKMFFETKRILGRKNIDLSFTCVRLPILGGHAESVNFELENQASLEDVKQALINQEGIIFIDSDKNGEYPTPLSVSGKDEVFVGRLRQDENNKNSYYMWVVADNLRKGAATNAVQILQKMQEMKLV
jgi:aspartate-semialdehyde dehydrogenase